MTREMETGEHAPLRRDVMADLKEQARLTMMRSSRDYIQIRSPVYIPHSAGRYAVKRFRKANCPIIERLTNSLMMHGRNNGKKLMAVRIVAHSFEIVSLLPFTRHCTTLKQLEAALVTIFTG